MKLLSDEITYFVLMITIILISLAIDGECSWLWSIVPVIYYIGLWFFIKIFIWDKKEIVLSLGVDSFKLGDIIKTRNVELLIIDKTGTDYIVYPLTKNRKMKWIKLSYKIRNLFKTYN